MSLQEVASQLVSLCSQGKGMEAIETLYSDDIVSIEAQGSDEMPATMKGIEAIKGKNQWWFDNHEVHGMKVQGPFIGGREDQFGALFEIDVTPKASGERMQMTEIALYTIKDGKIAQEEFWYQVD